MRSLALLLLSALFVTACGPKPLVRRVQGTWLIDHYNEWTVASSTGHALDRMGYIAFRKDGSGGKSLSATKPHGSFGSPMAFRWSVTDSVVSIMELGGREVERWLVTSNYPTYMEWVSVNTSKDTVRTLYLMKR